MGLKVENEGSRVYDVQLRLYRIMSLVFRVTGAGVNAGVVNSEYEAEAHGEGPAAL